MKYVVWIKENGAWVEQGDGPLSKATAERIAREIRADFRIPVKIEAVMDKALVASLLVGYVGK